MANEAKRDFVKELKRLPSSVFLRQCGMGDMGDFERLKAGAFDVSIQASRTHYSTPRELLPEADAYSAFEVAIFQNGEWVSPMRDARFSARPWAELFGDSDISVAGYVPRETVAQILADVEAVQPLTHEKQERIQGQGGAKHTSGPWKLEDDGPVTSKFVIPIFATIAKGARWSVAHAIGANAESRANAKLIAAAPELADALEALLTTSEDFASSDPDMPSHHDAGAAFDAAVEAARAALRKAGRE